MTELEVLQVYAGSDGDRTKAMYAKLEQLGPVGKIAVDLFRAQKASARAKVYRGGLPGRGRFKDMAYERKQWAMDNLTRTLLDHAAPLEICWGWRRDEVQEFHQWVLYVELPTGQVSFHTARRNVGPEYLGEWDGVRDVAATRIARWIAGLA